MINLRNYNVCVKLGYLTQHQQMFLCFNPTASQSSFLWDWIQSRVFYLLSVRVGNRDSKQTAVACVRFQYRSIYFYFRHLQNHQKDQFDDCRVVPDVPAADLQSLELLSSKCQMVIISIGTISSGNLVACLIRDVCSSESAIIKIHGILLLLWTQLADIMAEK